MKITEIFDTAAHLLWAHEGDVFTTKFSLDDRTYGVTAQEDEIKNVSVLRIDFHFEDKDGRLHHEATGINKDALKIIGIVGNGIAQKFKGKYDAYYFIAKRTTSNNDKEFQSRVKIYSRLCSKLSIEHNLRAHRKSYGTEFVFLLSKSLQVENELIAGLEL